MSKEICKGYNPWVFNGESSSAQTSSEIPNSHVQENPIEYVDLHDILHDMFPIQDMAFGPMEEVPTVQQPTEGPAQGNNEDALQFMKLLEDANQPCKHFSKLSVIVHLYHSVLMVGPTNHLPCFCNFCLIFFLQMLSCQKIVIRLGRLLRIWA